MEKRQPFQPVVLFGHWKATCKTMRLEHSLTPYTKINSKWFRDLSVRPENIKLLERTQAEHSDINHSNIFLEQSPKAKEIKATIDKWDLIKLKIFCTTKETTDKTKRQPMVWEKIFLNNTTNKGLISKIYKQITQLNIKKKKKKNNPIKNGQKTWIDIFPKRTYRWLTGT